MCVCVCVLVSGCGVNVKCGIVPLVLFSERVCFERDSVCVCVCVMFVCVNGDVSWVSSVDKGAAL